MEVLVANHPGHVKPKNTSSFGDVGVADKALDDVDHRTTFGLGARGKTHHQFAIERPRLAAGGVESFLG